MTCTLMRCTPMGCTPTRCTPMRCTPVRGTPTRCTPMRCTPVRGTPTRCTPMRYMPMREARRERHSHKRYAPARDACPRDACPLEMHAYERCMRTASGTRKILILERLWHQKNADTSPGKLPAEVTCPKSFRQSTLDFILLALRSSP